MGMGNGIPDRQYTFLKIPFTEFHNQCESLWISHFNEVGFLDSSLYNIDTDRYLFLEKNGYLVVLVVKLEQKIIGYAVILNDRFMHSKDAFYAKIDAIYIDNKYRSLTLFKSLLQYIENYLRAYPIKYLFISSTTRRALDKLLSKYDYKPIETLFCKEL